ncbi:MAG: ice-binding family protein [bacterium]|nr:ice-binding family protein [bacterium]
MKKLNKNSIVTTVLTVALVLGFTGSTVAAGPAAVNLGTAGNFVILSKSGITNVPTSAITGNIGVSPIDYAAITGFTLIPTVPDGTNTFSTSAQVTGQVFAADYTEPTPTNLGIAVLDMEAAYTDAAGRTNPTATELFAGNLGGRTLAPGLYKWGTGVTIPTDVTLSGGTDDVWIFQIAGTLNIATGKQVILVGGAQAQNIFWQVADVVALQAGSHFEGIILAQTNITMVTGATLTGRALAQTAVTLQSNTVNAAIVAPSNIFALTAEIETANTALVGVVEGTVPGNHVVGSSATLQSAIDAASFITPASAQSVVDATVTTLNTAVSAFNAAIVASSDVSFLTVAKASAQGLITANATESTTPGDHIVGSLATLTSAEAAANATNASAQSVVDGQVATLNTAIATYNAAIVATPTPTSGTVNLGTAANFVILSKSGITNVPTSAITGNIGVSPITYTAITGFALTPVTPDGSNTFSTSAQVTGKVFAADYTEPTPTNLGIAVLDMEAAYTDALSRATNVLNTGSAGEIGGLTLAPGVYTFTGDSINVLISTDLTLDGSSSDVWIFQIPGTLDIASKGNIESGIKVNLTGGAQASNVFWAVAEATTLGTYSTFNGNILAKANIAIQTGAVLNGRALAQTEVSLDANTVTAPASTPVDTVAPVIVVHADVSASGAVVTYTSPATSDAVDGAGVATCLPASGSTFPIGNTTVTCNATDVAGNQALATTFTVTVIETPAPAPVSSGGGGYYAPTPTPTPIPTTTPAGEVLGIATFNFTANLRLGMKGNAITELQKRLTVEGVYSGPITGYFGPLTLGGVKAYQKKYGISQTGFVGPLTRGQLNASQVAGVSTVSAEAIRTQIASVQAQLIVLIQRLIQMLQAQLQAQV